ncbi:MAG: DUF4403 family protein [Holophaga sp.]
MRPQAFLPLMIGSALWAQAPSPDPGPSFIAAPIRINLDPIFKSVEELAPKVPPGIETWTPLPSPPGAVYRFNLYREPFNFRVSGSHIFLHTIAHYWLEVGLKAGSFVKGVGSCGLGKEGYRRVLLGTRADLSLTPTWGLDLKVQLDDPAALSPCAITFLNYDISDRVTVGMKENLLKATVAMEQQVRDSAMLRQKAEAMWTQAQQPLALTEGVWLSLNPERIRITPWTVEGRVLILTPELQVRPVITLGDQPLNQTRPLPPLESSLLPIPPGFRVRVQADLPFEHATAQLRRQIQGKRFDTDKGSFEVLDASVRGQHGKAILDLQLKGKITGRLTLQGHPTFDPSTGTLQILDLDYTLESRSWITQFGEWLYRTTLKKTLQEKANWFMDQSLKDVKTLAQQGLNRTLAPGLSISGTLGDMTLGQPTVLTDRFRVEASISGLVEVNVDATGVLGGGK